MDVDDHANIILLCRVDHKRVDDQPAHFTPEGLRRIKADHEGRVAQPGGPPEIRIVFSDLYFAGPEQSVRPGYRYAIGMRLTNVGGGPALHVHWTVNDPEQRCFAEVVHRAASTASESTDDWCGLSNEKGEDPSEAEARAFYERCIATAECWDSQGGYYLFWPRGGSKMEDWRGGPDNLRQRLSQYPSRGQARRSLVTGSAVESEGPSGHGPTTGSDQQ